MKAFVKKIQWVILVMLMSGIMIYAGYMASGNIWIDGEPTFRYYVALGWEILRGIAVFVPIWLLCLLGLVRCFLGENCFPFAEKIPVRVTKTVLVAAAILLAGVIFAGAVYSEYSEVSYRVRYAMKNRLETWQAVLGGILFYGILLYAEQWGIHRNVSRKHTRKIQTWITVTIFLLCLCAFFIGDVGLWYVPLTYVDSPNRLEDYYLWWFSLYLAVFVLPLWFFSARKTIRLMKNNAQWLMLSTAIPLRLTAVFAFAESGVMIWQIREWCYGSAGTAASDVPEYGAAVAMAHLFQFLMWGLALFYTICLLVKQLRAALRVRRGTNI